MFENDQIRLRHMLDAAYTAMRLAQGRTRHDLDADEELIAQLEALVPPEPK